MFIHVEDASFVRFDRLTGLAACIRYIQGKWVMEMQLKIYTQDILMAEIQAIP